MSTYSLKGNIGDSNYLVTNTVRQHTILCDEPIDLGGHDGGAAPFELLASSLSSCTLITLKMYANHKGLDFGAIRVDIELTTEKIENQLNLKFVRTLQTDKQPDGFDMERLIKIATACPVSKALSSASNIEILTQISS